MDSRRQRSLIWLLGRVPYMLAVWLSPCGVVSSAMNALAQLLFRGEFYGFWSLIIINTACYGVKSIKFIKPRGR